MIEATIVRAHQQAASAKGGQHRPAFGRSRGGFTTKIHAACDSHGKPVRFILTAGPCSAYDQALALLEGRVARVVLADKGYDADYLAEAIRQRGAKVVIPPRSHRKTQRRYDKEL